MIEPATTPEVVVAPKGTLLKASGIALLIASIVLATVVLPAEYGIDPVGTGKVTGLINMAEPSGATVVPRAAAADGPVATRSAGYKVDAIEFALLPGNAVEYKYHLDAGATMLYTWKASAPLEFDLHTEPDQGGADASDSFEAGTKADGHGSYVAPYAGIHGWYWKNTSETETVKIVLQTAGFYSVAKMFAGSPEPIDMEVQDPPPPPTF